MVEYVDVPDGPEFVPEIISGSRLQWVMSRYTVADGNVVIRTAALQSVMDLVKDKIMEMIDNPDTPENLALDLESNLLLFQCQTSFSRTEKAVTDLRFIPGVTDSIIDKIFVLAQ